ncbi:MULTISPECIES: CDC48 family AAA ATPase [unclassified Haladaptatus]|uniref:CDC48 family AAA ATPase n=1 Tax=unclassified Haladaptatus TaxID=2622732 RepID=UPI0023E8A9CC|nr:MULTISPECIES: CDC48 family AAA ATPase [unclassified Haladaptatus]
MSSGVRDEGLTLTVQSAEKRDAGRGVARLPEAARRQLGVLSGDTVIIEGAAATVAKVWPAGAGLSKKAVRIDADTRANAGVNIGDEVTVRPVEVADATSIEVKPESDFADDDEATRAIREALMDRPLTAGEQIHVQRLGNGPLTVSRTRPDGIVRVTQTTRITLLEPDSPQKPAVSSTAPTRPSGVNYEDIGGLDDELEQVREMIELPLSEPDLFTQLGIDPPKGVLLYGPPGTGKTLIAKAVANEVNAHFSVISGPEIVSKYKGESEEKLREAFETATANAPAIIFIDEIDSIAGTRDDDADMETRVVAQLLTLLDGLNERGQVVVIGATNRVDAIDPALRRGGRFDREIEIGVPGIEGRREILDVHTRGMPLADDVDVERIAKRTHGFVGADLKTLVTEAAMHALRGREEGKPLTVTRADFDAAMAAVDPSAMREYVAETPSVNFSAVGGLDEAKQTLEEAVIWPLEYGALFDAADTDPPSGVLLYGPPGTGKTLLARALAGESEVNFIHVAGPELLDRYVGESEKAVRKVFDRARQAAPAIVFFDEIDAIAARRDDSHEVTERVVSQLLTEMDGVVDNPNLMVLAATNRREVLDPALVRAGRLETHIEVPAPDEPARKAILAVHLAGKPLADDVDQAQLATDTRGYSGADLRSLVRQAAMFAIRDLAADIGPAEANARADELVITAAHFARALEQVEPSLT